MLQIQVALVRIVVPGVLFIPVAVGAIRRPGTQMPPRLILKMAGAGLLGFGVFHLGVAFGQRWTSASATGLLTVVSPLATIIVATLLGVDAMSSRRWLGLALCVAGVIVVCCLVPAKLM